MDPRVFIAIVAIIYLGSLLGIGFWAQKRASKASDFLVAGRKLGTLLCACTIAAVQIGAGVVVGGATNGAIYNGVTGYFGDILSYSRLMALMLAGSVIAQVFNTIAAIPGNIVVFLIISLVGNALNFALNLLGCFVHDLRLQCLEYFGKFYEDGGKPFRPLAVNTKYVTVTNTDK